MEQTHEITAGAARTLSYDALKAEALRLGFSAFGVARAEAVGARDADALRRWLAGGCHGGMDYMARHEALRLDPRGLLPGAQSVVVVAMNYLPARRMPSGRPQLALYAYGRDYHDILRERLYRLAAALPPTSDASPGVRVCVDTAPLLERYWAAEAGLGWIGRNTCLILPGQGSFFFLGVLLTTCLSDRYDAPIAPRCGHCRKCVAACPTQALGGDCTLDARRCLSYLSIEHRGPIPPELGRRLRPYIYGCDRCQLVCPHNAQAQPTAEPAFAASEALLDMDGPQWSSLTPERYRTLFAGSAVKRAKYEGLMRNIAAWGADFPEK